MKKAKEKKENKTGEVITSQEPHWAEYERVKDSLIAIGYKLGTQIQTGSINIDYWFRNESDIVLVKFRTGCIEPMVFKPCAIEEIINELKEKKDMENAVRLLTAYSKWKGDTSPERELINAIKVAIGYLKGE